ncbi:hypothetical protein R1flu_011037 [Riccia fluitans]|uniref:Uncharacterized protein n=1 Tax=Riccia fluitans TaxID=41844 RepID=A0ABD1Z6V3_9MARC
MDPRVAILSNPGVRWRPDVESLWVPGSPGEKAVGYPNRPVDYSTDFDGSTAPPQSDSNLAPLQQQQMQRNEHMMQVPQMHQQLHMQGMQRIPQNSNMGSYGVGNQQGKRKEPDSGNQNYSG